MNTLLFLIYLGWLGLLSTILSCQATTTTAQHPLLPVQKIPVPDETCTFFGEAVVMSPDGNTAAAGCPNALNYLGLVYVYARSTNGQWVQQAVLNGTDKKAPSGEGYYLTMSYDGNTMATPARYYGAVVTGTIYIYSRSHNVWSQDVNLWGPSGRFYFGATPVLSHDGNTLAATCSDSSLYHSAVVIFVRGDSSGWTQQGDPLEPTDGTKVSASRITLSPDGNTLAVPCTSGQGVYDFGGIQIFVRSKGIWSQSIPRAFTSYAGQADLYPIGFAQGAKYILALLGLHFVVFDFNGTHYEDFPVYTRTQLPNFEVLARSGNGASVLASGVTDSTVSVFSRSSISPLTYQESQTIKAFDASEKRIRFGAGMSLSADGNRAIISATADDNYPGSIYFYERKNVANCQAKFGMKKAACKRRIKSCGKQGFKLKWTGPGCKQNGKKMGDGGCQCKGYCGYTCRTACVKDKECKWQGGVCTDKNGTPGGSVMFCGLV